ncbi:MAG: DNA polymerase III subunit beta [Bacteroidota bacterium]|nr:DNA polymerase III subunit beta [Bacteroidota bacterium]MDP4226757.1 DNA polymerase III subunit beta [Bacteroidota bacterium]MDP4275010.1 DNA polymerase III subunit beta [Bacteroidota bacterium]
MKFVASSTDLLSHLQAISKVINTKNTLPILDNFLFRLENNELEITASDLETTLITKMTLENASGDGIIALPAKLLNDTLKEFPEQPLTFDINDESLAVTISSENGQFNIPGQNGVDFPKIPEIKEDKKSSVRMGHDVLFTGIDKTHFASAEDELRPVMNGIFVELSTESVTFVASDAHKLVRYIRKDVKADSEASFILPKKPATLLRSILPKEENEVLVEFDDKNVFIQLTDYKMFSRLVEGTYPSYNSVIPTDNPNKLTIDRLDLYNSLRRVSVFSNQASNLIKMNLTGNQVTVSAQDIDFSISAYERLNAQYEGEDMEIGFKSSFLVEILSNLAVPEVVFELSDPSRAGIIVPAENENPDEDILMLIMPMMIGA